VKSNRNRHSGSNKLEREKSPKKGGNGNKSPTQKSELAPNINLTERNRKGEHVLHAATKLWLDGDWHRLADMDPPSLQAHSAKVDLALFAATGLLQCGNATDAEKLIDLARQWGAKKDEIGRILISSAYNSLGRAMALAGRPDKGLSILERSIAVGLPGCEARSLAETRSHNQLAELGLAAMPAVQVNLCSWELPSECGIIRQPTRAPDLRHGDFWERYDATTVIYDLFRTADPEMLLAICPPLHNLEQDLVLRFRAEPSGEPCSFTRQIRVNCDRLWIRVPRGTEQLVAETTIGEFPLIPSSDLTEVFRDRRVVFTLSKNNDLVWIRDWATYYVRVHGVDAVVVYDNGSTRYGRAEIEAALSTVPGLAVFAVIDWPFRYGPVDHRRSLTIGLTDCDYCQRGAMEHAARRMFAQAAGVINADIDELMFTTGHIGLFEALECSETGYLLIHGHWVEAVQDDFASACRHAAYSRILRREKPVYHTTKWVVAPRRLHPDAFWDIHFVVGAGMDRRSVDFRFGHFRAINTNWNTVRTDDAPEAKLEDLPELRTALDVAFPDQAEGFVKTPGSTGDADRFVRNIEAASLTINDEDGSSHTAAYWNQRVTLLSIEHHLGNADPEMIAKAIGFARRAVEAEPSNMYSLEILVSMLIRFGRIAEAPGMLDLARPGSEPRDVAHYHAVRAFALLPLQQLDDASAAIAAAVGHREDVPGYFLLQARIADASGMADAAADAYRTAARLAAGGACVAGKVEYMARRRYAIGQHGQFGTVSNLVFPTTGDILGGFIGFLLKHGRAEEAETEARKLICSEPLNLGSHVLMARCLNARESLDALVQTRDYCLATYNRICSIGSNGDQHEVAQAEYRFRLECDLATVLILTGDVAAGLDIIKQLIEDPIVVEWALLPVISELLKIGTEKEAHRLLSTFTDRKPDSLQALDLLLRTSNALKDVETARQVAGRLVGLRPNKGAPMATLGTLLLEAGNEEEGMEFLRDAVKREPDKLSHHSALFWALVSSSHNKEAEAQLLEIVYRFPKDPSAHLLMAKCMRWQERPELARLAAQRLLTLQPDNAEARKLLADLVDQAV